MRILLLLALVACTSTEPVSPPAPTSAPAPSPAPAEVSFETVDASQLRKLITT